MELQIKILNGKRQGDAFSLSLYEIKKTSTLFILEDEAIEISFSSEFYYEKISLLLYENEVEPTSIEKNDETWTYKWQPKRLNRFLHECFFHNYYGIAELSLETHTEAQSDILNFQPVEVLARKLNADRVEKMLSFLAKIDSEALCSFFRVTRRKAGYKSGDTPAEILLEQIENTTENISAIFKKIIKNPITKLSTKENYVYPDDTTTVDDLTLSWLCNNADEIFETDCIDHAILEHNNFFYGVSKLVEHQAIEDSDVYENQVLHGFVNTLIQSTSNLLSGFENPGKKAHKTNGTPLGYISFFSQIQKFQKSINQRKALKCRSILTNLHSLKRRLTEKIPSKKTISGIPTFTMKAKKDPLYLSAFKKIVEWHRFGSPDWSVQEELLSIQSIPKLFEYYSLFYVKEIVEKRCGSKSLPNPTAESISFTFNIKKGLYLDLYYEPRFWMPKHPHADLRGLVNSEGWTTYNGTVSPRSNSGRFSNRSPDFVIKIYNSHENDKYIILDAKYTTTDKSFTHYLPELTLKYIHGLHSISKDTNAINGLIIINPDESSLVRHFHNRSFDIFSDNPIMPSLLCASVSPGNEFSGNRDFEISLTKMVDLTVRQFADQNENIISLSNISA